MKQVKGGVTDPIGMYCQVCDDGEASSYWCPYS